MIAYFYQVWDSIIFFSIIQFLKYFEIIMLVNEICSKSCNILFLPIKKSKGRVTTAFNFFGKTKEKCFQSLLQAFERE